jgi:hypothetical protein
VVHVAARNIDVVEAWTVPSSSPALSVCVVGTGAFYPEEWIWLGTALAPSGPVWHLMEVR